MTNRPRWHRVISVAVVLTSLILVFTPVEAFAKHGAIVSNSPRGAELSTLTTFTLSVTNDAAVPGAKEIEKVELVVDSSWTVSATGEQPTPPTNWTVDVVGNTITWTAAAGSEIAVGSSLDFNWKATTAASVEYSSHSWTTTDIVAGTDTGTVGTVLSDWESYKEAAHTTEWGTPTDPYDSDTQTVYMYGEGFKASQLYHVGFYDPSAAPNKIASTDPSSTAAGALETQYLLSTDDTAEAGTWHAVVYEDPDSPPTEYTANDPNACADDDFEVTASAIPEFPTVMAGIAVAGLCFGIYYWMRKRRLAHVRVKA